MIASAMPQNYENQLETEYLSLNNIQLTLLIVGLLEFLLLHLLKAKKRISYFFFGFQPELFCSDHSKDRAGVKGRVLESPTKQEKRADQSVTREDVDIVLKSLGMFFNSDDIKFSPASLDADDLLDLFEEKNPSLDEVKETFDVFDYNRDGVIDAEELQKVLCALGFTEGSELQNCRKMIRAFDENGDGRMDFDEFVKFMVTSLC